MRIIPLAALAASLTVLGACGGGPAENTTAAANPLFADPAPAAPGGTIGPGTACPIPATLSTAVKWNPKDISRHGVIEGEATVRCEIDAKPAGVLGFIWVYTYDGGDARQVLKDVRLGGEKTAEQEVTIGGKSGIEAALASAEGTKGRAFAAGGVVVVWSGVDEDEYTAGLPAYILARSSITF